MTKNQRKNKKKTVKVPIRRVNAKDIETINKVLNKKDSLKTSYLKHPTRR